MVAALRSLAAASLVSGLAAAGCVVTPRAPVQSACAEGIGAPGCTGGTVNAVAEPRPMECEDWTPTGSNIARTRCVEISEVEVRREHDQEVIRRAQTRGRVDPTPGQ